jgi:hypothetical protein
MNELEDQMYVEETPEFWYTNYERMVATLWGTWHE